MEDLYKKRTDEEIQIIKKRIMSKRINQNTDNTHQSELDLFNTLADKLEEKGCELNSMAKVSENLYSCDITRLAISNKRYARIEDGKIWVSSLGWL